MKPLYPLCGEDCRACKGRGVVWRPGWDACPFATRLAEQQWREQIPNDNMAEVGRCGEAVGE